jgi:adhesin transport system outer membrane protein
VGNGADLAQISGRLSLAQTNLMTEQANLNDVSARFARIVGVEPSKSCTC